MRLLMVGAGGIGGYFGACYAAAGHDVTFLARGATLAALRERGLTVESAPGQGAAFTAYFPLAPHRDDVTAS